MGCLLRASVALAALAAVAIAACGPAPTGATVHVPAPTRSSDDASRGAEIVEAVLREMGAIDRRIALRTGIAPTEEDLHRIAMRALLAEDTSATVVDGALDPFSFKARARGLDEATSKLTAIPRGDERDLLTRFVGEERFRVVEESRLPESASELLRAIVLMWTPAASSETRVARDVWLSRRLEEVETSLGAPGKSLDSIAAAELDDALDPLERIAQPAEYPETAKRLVSLRGALGALPVTASATKRGSFAEAIANAHVGVVGEGEPIAAKLARGLGTLRAAIAPRVARLTKDEEAIVVRESNRLLFGEKRCAAASGSSRMRRIAPPPERAGLCAALSALTGTSSDLERLAVLTALHDHVVVALWSLDPKTNTRPVFPPSPEHEAHLARLAAARPGVAIGAGLMAELVARDGVDHARERAAAWLAWGDAPLDVIEKAAPWTAAPAPPRASPRP